MPRKKTLFAGRAASDGFNRLWEEGRLDLSVEYFVLLPKYATLFEPAEFDEARRFLADDGFDVRKALCSPVALTDQSSLTP